MQSFFFHFKKIVTKLNFVVDGQKSNVIAFRCNPERIEISQDHSISLEI